MGGQVNVAVDAVPSTDLNQVMTEIRQHYEGLIAKNRKELDTWYQNKVRRYNFCSLSSTSSNLQTILNNTRHFLSAQVAAVEQEVITNTECLATSRTEIKDLKSTLQRLEIELQSHLSMVCPYYTGSITNTM